MALFAMLPTLPAEAPPVAEMPDSNAISPSTNLIGFSPSPQPARLTVAKAVLPGYTIRRTVREVRMQFTVADSRGRLVQSLSAGDFQVFDNRSAVTQFGGFARLEDLPLQAAILLDISDSMQKSAWREKQATRFFLDHVFRSSTDRALLVAFSDEMKVRQGPTGEREALTQALASVQQQGYATNLFDSIFYTCREQFPQNEDSDLAQRVLVLLTDGEDTGSLHSLTDAVMAAQRRDVQIFAVAIHPARKYSPGDKVLRPLTETTGGQFYVAAGEKDFPGIFASMQQQMRTQYAVSFRPPNLEAGFHAVTIEAAGGDKLRVHARQGYFYDGP